MKIHKPITIAFSIVLDHDKPTPSQGARRGLGWGGEEGKSKLRLHFGSRTHNRYYALTWTHEHVNYRRQCMRSCA